MSLLARTRLPSPLLNATAHARLLGQRGRRGLASAAPDRRVKIVDVSPRDGLQNERGGMVATATKIELIRRLQDEAGVRCIEAGAFVSPKWVPQMGDTPDVLAGMPTRAGVTYPFLVPNAKGLETLLRLQGDMEAAGTAKKTDEIAIFTAASEGFCRANTNCSIDESLDRLAGVASKAVEAGLRVRGYVSVVAHCPYEGKVDPKRAADVSRKLLEMGCYEVSLGDTVGAASPSEMLAVLNECTRFARPEQLAAHCHDTMGSGLSNVLAMVNAGVRTVDSAVGGLGGCPYSPGATGNIDTESVVYALQREGYETGVDLEAAAKIGQWINEALGKANGSSAGRAILARLAMAQTKGKGEGNDQRESRL